MESFSAPKGTRDIYGTELKIMRFIERQFDRLLFLFGVDGIETPIFENANLFNRGVGAGSDIVNKEMYEFKDKGDRDLALRPEFTASIVRALIERKLYTASLPIKLGYYGPVFRYERPQTGRYRQFHQLGIEIFNEETFTNTIELMYFVIHYLHEIDLSSKVEIVINHLGDHEAMRDYHQALKDYYRDYIPNMCKDCQRRYETNILRILDCKIPADRKIIEKGPVLTDFLKPSHLDELNMFFDTFSDEIIPVRVDPFLVRGLDYYNGIVFEVRDRETGLALGGGGQYDKLVHELGGPDLKGCGMSFGLERLLNAIIQTAQENDINLSIVPTYNFAILPLLDDQMCINYALGYAADLRRNDFRVYADYSKSGLAKKLSRAEKNNVELAIIIGEDELENDEVMVKNMRTKEQIVFPVGSNIIDELGKFHLANFVDLYPDSEDESKPAGGEDDDDDKNPV